MSWQEAGAFFKAWRQDRGLTQVEVQQGSGVSVSTQSRLENQGDISEKLLRALAAFMEEDGRQLLRLAGMKVVAKPRPDDDPRARILLEQFRRLPESAKDEAFQDILELLRRR